MAQEYIEIRGARENNLRNVSLRIPKRKITIFTGVSGSGKSSIVFDTIASEAQRQLHENFSLFVRSFLPSYSQPDADAIENLSMAIVVDQKRLGGGAHSTVGTITDIYAVLRRLFSYIGDPHVGHVNVFSFNDPQGMCPECSGIGQKIGVDMERFFDKSKSLNEGAILFPDFAVGSWDWDMLIQSGLFDPDLPLEQYSPEQWERLTSGPEIKIKTAMGGRSINLTFMGVLDKFASKYIIRDLKTRPERTQRLVEPFITYGPCPLCQGARLSQAALSSRINGYNIADMASMEVGELIEIVRQIEDPRAAPIVAALSQRLQNLVDIGLDYLTLSRETDSLSGGESQRVKIVKHLSSSLVDVMYIFDEPSIGLHPRDVHRLNELLIKLRDKGNTVLVVEHDPDVIRVADHVVDLGPRAGRHGGELVYEGSYEGLLAAETLTGQELRRPASIKSHFRTPKGHHSLRHVQVNNLHDISVDIPAGVLVAVTGVAGSGKSSLILQAFLRQHPEAVVVDQSAVGISTRSNPATYTGIMDEVRKAFAAANGVSASLFSFNSDGACENCQGLGVIYTDLAALSEVKSPCETCEGRRFKEEVLAYTLDGKSISDVLAMTMAQALDFFRTYAERVRKVNCAA